MRIVLILMSEKRESVNPIIRRIFIPSADSVKTAQKISGPRSRIGALKLCNYFGWFEKPLEIIEQDQRVEGRIPGIPNVKIQPTDLTRNHGG